MATTIIRKPASFRLRADLLEGLKRNAARENRTLNNYVESVLLDIVYHEPNDVTKAAIAEAQSGKNPNKVYDSVDELFNDLDAEKWRKLKILKAVAHFLLFTILFSLKFVSLPSETKYYYYEHND